MSQVEQIMEHINNLSLSDEEYLSLWGCITLKLNEVYGCNMIDNYAYREKSTVSTLNSILNYLVKHLPGRSGPDYEIPELGIEKGELKTNTFVLKKTISYFRLKDFESITGEFDKQLDPLRREECLEYNSFTFSSYCHNWSFVDPLAVIHITTKNGVEIIREVIKKKQKEKIKLIQKQKELGKKVSRDSILVKVGDFINDIPDEDIIILWKKRRIKKEEFLSMIIKKETIIEEGGLY
jgi:hypothetical protein